MGYEIIFKCHEKNSESVGYNTENIKEYKKNVGKATEDTPLEQLAKIIFGQLARRDVWVIDAEIYEYSKKKLSFKETKEGILLKNKKFSFDLSCENIDLAPESENIEEESVVKPQKKLIPPIVKKESPLRWEIYDPHPDIAIGAKNRKLKFTLGKKYPIFLEKPDPRGVMYGMSYLVEDDLGEKMMLNDKHFTPPVNILENGFESEFKSAEERIALSQQNTITDSLPSIRTFN